MLYLGQPVDGKVPGVCLLSALINVILQLKLYFTPSVTICTTITLEQTQLSNMHQTAGLPDTSIADL